LGFAALLDNTPLLPAQKPLGLTSTSLDELSELKKLQAISCSKYFARQQDRRHLGFSHRQCAAIQREDQSAKDDEHDCNSVRSYVCRSSEPLVLSAAISPSSAKASTSIPPSIGFPKP